MTAKRTLATYPVHNVRDLKRSLFEWVRKYSPMAYFDSNGYSQKYSSFEVIAALGAEASLKMSYKDGFDACKSFYDEVNDWLFGYFTYDMKNDVERLDSKPAGYIAFPDLYFFRPKKIIYIKDKKIHFMYMDSYRSDIDKDYKEIVNAQSEAVSGASAPVVLTPSESQEAYFEKVKKTIDHIHRGDVYELNLCTSFFAETKIDPFEIFKKLNKVSPAPFASFFRLSDMYVLSASPERFLKKIGAKVISEPIKGTIRRSGHPQTDLEIKRLLKELPKERAENIMTVDLVRNDLSKLAKKGSVKVEELCEVYTFPRLHQLLSVVSCEVGDQAHLVDIIKSMFPMASMTGVPKLRAMQIIETLEPFRRGLYSGAIGYMTPHGDFDFNVVIRTILYDDRHSYLSAFAGGAITSRSVAEAEYQEILLKIESLKAALN